MKKGSLFLGFIIGGIAGSTIALLTTPKSGQELKETILTNSGKVKDTIDTLKKETTQLKNQVIQVSKEGSIILKDFSKDLKTTVDTWKKEVEPNKTNIIDELKNIEETLQELEKMTKS